MLAVMRQYKLPFVVRCDLGLAAIRSLDQNALSHVWYSQIAEQSGLTKLEAKAFCKLLFGVPIMSEKSDAFKRAYDKHMKSLSYGQKINFLIATDMPVTSTFNSKEMSEYMENMYRYFKDKGIELRREGDL